MKIANLVSQIRVDYIPGSLWRRHGILHMKRMYLEWNNLSPLIENLSTLDENRLVWIFLIWGNVTTSQTAGEIYHYCYILTLHSETRWTKVTNCANLIQFLTTFVLKKKRNRDTDVQWHSKLAYLYICKNFCWLFPKDNEIMLLWNLMTWSWTWIAIFAHFTFEHHRKLWKDFFKDYCIYRPNTFWW